MAHTIVLATLPLPTVKAQVAVTHSGASYLLPTLPAPVVEAALSVADGRIISGHPVLIFNIPQVANLTLPSQTYQGVRMNNYPVDRTDFRLVRGVTNEIVFFVRDIDRKPFALPVDDSLTINIVDVLADTLLMTRDLTTVDSSKGIYQLATLSDEMDTWPSGPIRWSIAYNRSGNGTVMLWTDLSYSPYSNLYLTEGPIPGPAPTVTVAFSDFVLVDSLYYSSSFPGAAQNGYANGVQTFVANMSNFTGTIRLDGSLAAQPDPSPDSPDWFAADSMNYTAFTGNDTIDVVGNYVWMRIVITVGSGTVNQVSYKV